MTCRAALGGLLAVAACSGCARVKQEDVALANGLKAEVIKAPGTERVGVALLFAVGHDHDPPSRSGMSRLALRIFAGDRWTAVSGRDHSAVLASCSPQELGATLKALASRMAELKVTGEVLSREREVLLRDLAAARGGDPAQAAENFALEAVRPSRGGGFWAGVAEELRAATAAEVQAFVDAGFKATSARLVVVGDVELADARALIEASFAAVPPGATPAARPPEESRVSGTLVMGDAPSAVALAVPAPAPSEATFPAFLVLAARLGRAAPERPWSSRFDPLWRPQALFAGTVIAPAERPEDAAARLRQEVSAVVAQPLSSGEAKQALEAYGRALGAVALKPSDCKANPAEVAYWRARVAQLRIDRPALGRALEAVDAERLAAAVKLFEPRLTAAVAAGGRVPGPE